MTAIDLWDSSTFDPDLLAALKASEDLIRIYLDPDRGGGLSQEQALLPDLEPVLKQRTARCWHYTRLTDKEVERLRQGGIQPSTLETVRERLDLMVQDGAFDQPVADALFDESIFRRTTSANRGGFCVVTGPSRTDSATAIDLVRLWGGESVSFTQDGRDYSALLSRIGHPRVLEVAVPIASCQNASRAVREAGKAFGANLGFSVHTVHDSLRVVQPLPPEAILAVHSAGDVHYADIGTNYPPNWLAKA